MRLSINLVMSIVNSLLLSNLQSQLEDADYRDLTNVISDAMEYSLLTTEHRDDTIAVKSVIQSIRSSQILDTMNHSTVPILSS